MHQSIAAGLDYDPTTAEGTNRPQVVRTPVVLIAGSLALAAFLALIVPRSEHGRNTSGGDRGKGIAPIAVGDKDRKDLSALVAVCDGVDPCARDRARTGGSATPRASKTSHIRNLTHHVRPGETLSDVLGLAGVSPQQIDEWVRATNPVYNLNRIYVGQEISLWVDTRSNTLRHLALDIDPMNRLVARRRKSEVVARRQPIQHDRHLRVVSATISNSLYETALETGIPERIVSELAETLGWELNLSRDLQPGASLRVVYEELTRPGTDISIPGRVLAAEVTNRGQRYEVFHFGLAEEGQSGYYTREGDGIGRAFLRYPVAYSRISSHFSNARFHPVLKRKRPHYGVDFAAPRGTPVHAIADGTVRLAGWRGSAGRFVRIKHDAVYASDYAHLSKIAPEVRNGATVKRGQVIGYVGSSGRATGPHLHFAMHRYGKYINPLTADLPRGKGLSGEALGRFHERVALIDGVYARAGADADALLQVASLRAD